MMANANQKGALIMNYDYRVVGQIIGRIRVQREMSQEVLSGLAGVARSHLAMIESGSKNANVETLWRIASCRFVNDLGVRKKLRNLWERTRQEGA